MKLAYISCLVLLTYATVHFSEEFTNDWQSRWVHSSKPDFAKFELSSGKWFVDEVEDRGIQTKIQAKSYAISAKFPSFNNDNKQLVIQYTVKNEQHLDCGGGYLKVLPEGFDQENFSGQTPYLVMFGPDICGSDKKTHVLLPYQGKNFINNKRFKVETDNLTHLYTLVLNPDNTFQVLIDNEEASSGNIEDYFDILPAKEIADPDAKKPGDWVDSPTIVDETDVKPSGWDDIQEFMIDTTAAKPEDWDDEKDGEWKAPKVHNPEYKGEWKQKTVPNPNYKGPWNAPKIANPEYKQDANLYKIGTAGGVGIEIWQVTAGTIFDNIFIGDSLEEAQKFADRTFKNRKEKEPAIKSALDEVEEAKRQAAQPPIENMEDFGDYEDIEDFRQDL